MKKILFIVLTLFAFAVRADNVITSKEYVDTAAGGLQEQIGANNANIVLTYTDTAGTLGEKKIYDSSAAYSGQNDSLVTAGAFNTAVQNALETEFVCIDWLGDVHDNAHCLLYQIRSIQPQNPFRGAYLGAITQTRAYLYSGGYNEIVSPYTPTFMFRGPIFIATVEPGAKYYMSGETDATYRFYAFYASEADIKNYDKTISYAGWGKQAVKEITVPAGATCLVLSFSNDDTRPITWSNVRLERQYLPSGN